MHTQNESPPLGGMRVVDFGHCYGGMLLADQGAEVIKVDRPAKAGTKSPADSVFNRGKKRLELDLKTAIGWENSLQRIYRASDGWIYLVGLDRDGSKLQTIPELAGVAASRR